VQLLKSGQVSYMQSGSLTQPYYNSIKDKYMMVDAIKQGHPLPEGASDSDVDFSDRVLALNQWVDCLDTSHKWLCAQIIRIEGNRVELRYDGWSDRWNEFLEMSDPRVRPLGSFTTPEAVANIGKPRAK